MRWMAAGSLVTELDPSVLKSDHALQAALATFAKKPLHPQLYKRLNPPEDASAKKRTVTRFVVLKAFDMVPASLQMVLVHRLAEVEDLGLRFVFLADDAKSVASAPFFSLLRARLSALFFSYTWRLNQRSASHLLPLCPLRR